MFHACIQRFDGMDEKFLVGKLNRASLQTSQLFFAVSFSSTALFTSQKILQNFSYFPSHRIFRRMHGILNIDENKN